MSTTETLSLLDYANGRDKVILSWSSVGTLRGDRVPLGYPDLDFADRNGLLDLSGAVDPAGDWQWDGEGDPTDDRRNSITRLSAGADASAWDRIVETYESGESEPHG